jgi:hypothetical protein
MSLTPGDWDVSGNVVYATTGDTVVATALLAWINTVSATPPTFPGKGAFTQRRQVAAPFNDDAILAGTLRLSLGATTTVFLSTYALFSPGSGTKAYGFLQARRRR